MSSAPGDKTLVMTATYNEIENLPRLVEEIFRYAPESICWWSTTIRPTGPANGATSRRPPTREFIACIGQGN